MSKENVKGVVPALICVPDLSGFTEFIIKNDIDISREVVPTLLTGILDSNILDLKVGDIQGDAVFFYKLGKTPSISEIISQCRKIYQDFTQKIRIIESLYKRFDLYIPTNYLGLKFVIHFGYVGITRIEEYQKLIGKDVIIPFKLLKNNVKLDQYILLTKSSLDFNGEKNIESILDWEEIHYGSDSYKYIGKVDYLYVSMENQSLRMEKP